MTIVYLNGEYMPIEQAKISPMDRGFLFGDGIYEVITSYDGQMVGFTPHIERMFKGLEALEIKHQFSRDQLWQICTNLYEQNGGGSLGIYLHVSRGADTKRAHGYPDDLIPTLFAYAFSITKPLADAETAKQYRAMTQQDLRWQRCNIKSTALLGNVMHYQQGQNAGCDETILFNHNDEITEASSCNVFVVKNGVVSTPLLDGQKLPGVTRLMLITILREHSDITVEERVVTKKELEQADEVWLSSSSKQVGPVVEVDGRPIADGKIGPLWSIAQSLFAQHQFDFND